MKPFVAALGAELDLTSEEIAEILWLAVQIGELPQPETIETPSVEQDRESSPQLPIDRPTQQPKASDPTEPTPPRADVHLQDRSTNLGGGLTIALPDARSLREPLTLARSLKPLLQKVASGWSNVLDEAVTIDRIVNEKLWLPTFKPNLEPWLDLVLVVDESLSMQIWQRTISEVQRFLAAYGVFRDVRVYSLVIEGKRTYVRPRLGTAGKMQTLRNPQELIDPSGRRLILVATDCVSSLWRTGEFLPALQLWAKTSPMAILQMLPEWLWSRSGLGLATSVRFATVAAGVPNDRLLATSISFCDDLDLDLGIKVPIVTLESEPIEAWAQLIAGKGGVQSPGVVFDPEPLEIESELEIGAPAGTGAERVRRFQATASPLARQLAMILAAAPAINLPIVRILQDRLLPRSQQVHVAEVFLGGLLKPLAEVDALTNPDTVPYDFMDEVRSVLLKSVRTSEVVNVLGEVSTFVAEQLGLTVDEFIGVLRNPQANGKVASLSRPFAMVTAEILQQLGGEYTKFAEDLIGVNQIDGQQGAAETNPEQSDYRYQLGGSLGVNDPSYVERQADRELYNSLKSGEFCYVFNSLQSGKSSLRVRAMQKLQRDGVTCAAIDLTGIGSRNVTAEQWYYGLMDELISDLQLKEAVDLDEFWDRYQNLSPLLPLREFVDTVLLKQITTPIVIFIDEIDSLLSLDFDTDEFFAYIRSCYNQCNINPEYRRLTFCLLGVATPTELIRDVKRSPFDIGISIELNGFQLTEAQPLVQGLVGKAENPQLVMQEILNWTGGQPFLTQKLCGLILELPDRVVSGSEAKSVKRVVRERIIDNWEAQDIPEHLKTIHDRLLRSQYQIELLEAYQKILENGETITNNSREDINLRLSGLVVKRHSKLFVYNPIYATVFDRAWVDRALNNSQPPEISVKKVLFLTTNPLDTVRLNLEQEVEEVIRTLKLSPHRDRFAIEHRSAVRASDLARYLHDIKPWIVHFSVIGERDGLQLEGEDGRSQLVSGTTLANLFKPFSNDIKCVILSASESLQQAQEIVKYIPYVVGIYELLFDSTAIKFSQGFYQAIWDGRSIEEAFASGKNGIEIEGIPEELTPVLLCRSNEAISSELSHFQPEINSVNTRPGLQRLEKEKHALEKQYSLIVEKLARLRIAGAIESDATIEFKLKHQIEQAELELEIIIRKLEEIENSLTD